MKRVLAIAARELDGLFRLPVGWISIALFVLVAGVVFVGETLTPGQPATMRYFFVVGTWMLVPVAPAISMRLLAEELRSGTIEPLMTAPVGDASVVWGKYLGAVAFLLLMLAPTLVFVLVLRGASDRMPDLGPIAGGYLGLTLVGMVYLAVGTLTSTLTSSQTLAFLGTLIALVLALLLSELALSHVGPNAAAVLAELSIPARMRAFAKGVVDLRDIVALASASVLLVTVAAVSLESRRWR